MQLAIAEFMRYSAPDPAALVLAITDAQAKLALAEQASEAVATVDAAADLAGMLTTARREREAVCLLERHLRLASQSSQHEPAGWFWNAYATALQYCGEREQAEPHFIMAIQLAHSGGWRRLEALALHHWARSLTEQRRLAEAEICASQALSIRVELGDPRQESSRRALAAIQALREKSTRTSDAGDA
jgi:hypothetical protein